MFAAVAGMLGENLFIPEFIKQVGPAVLCQYLVDQLKLVQLMESHPMHCAVCQAGGLLSRVQC